MVAPLAWNDVPDSELERQFTASYGAPFRISPNPSLKDQTLKNRLIRQLLDNFCDDRLWMHAAVVATRMAEPKSAKGIDHLISDLLYSRDRRPDRKSQEIQLGWNPVAVADFPGWFNKFRYAYVPLGDDKWGSIDFPKRPQRHNIDNTDAVGFYSGSSGFKFSGNRETVTNLNFSLFCDPNERQRYAVEFRSRGRAILGGAFTKSESKFLTDPLIHDHNGTHEWILGGRKVKINIDQSSPHPREPEQVNFNLLIAVN